MNKFLVLLISFISGFVLMSVELLFPRISAIWFGNILNIWAINIAMSLLIIGFGYKTGSILLKRGTSPKKILLTVYGLVALYLAVFPDLYTSVLDSLIHMNENLGAMLFSCFLMLPTIGLLAVSSPVLVSRSKPQLDTSAVFFSSTTGGALSILTTGLFLIPYHGIGQTFIVMAAFMALNLVVLFLLKPTAEKP